MRVRPVSPIGKPGDRPEPSARTRFPTADPLPPVDHERKDLRLRLYAAAKNEPITAETAATLTGLPLIEARDELRIMENWLLLRHTVTEAGVVYWRWNPANYHELEPVPF